MNIRLYMTHPMTRVLGPFQRYAVWVQGCSKCCPGCISPDAQPLDGGYTKDIKHLAHEILSQPDIEGITVSGGEPFLQEEALCKLIDTLRSKRDLGVIVYTGMLYEEIADTPLAKRSDLIVDGEYVEDLNDDRSLRGSANQKIICITKRYKTLVPQYYGTPGRKVEFCFCNNSVHMIGVPSRSTANLIGE